MILVPRLFSGRRLFPIAAAAASLLLLLQDRQHQHLSSGVGVVVVDAKEISCLFQIFTGGADGYSCEDLLASTDPDQCGCYVFCGRELLSCADGNEGPVDVDCENVNTCTEGQRGADETAPTVVDEVEEDRGDSDSGGGSESGGDSDGDAPSSPPPSSGMSANACSGPVAAMSTCLIALALLTLLPEL